MNYWDSSALVALLVEEDASAILLRLHEKGHTLITWILTPVEMLSALSRLHRMGAMKEADFARATQSLKNLSRDLVCIRDVDAVTDRAGRLLRLHPLQAADALQLASALIACQDQPDSHRFITLDERLARCARQEGFDVPHP